MLYRIGNQLRLCQALSVGQEYLYGKLIAVSVWEETYLQRWCNECRQQDDTDASTDSHPRMLEGPIQHLVIYVLHPMCDGVATGTNLARLDDVYFKERDDSHSQNERHHQVDGNRDGEVL